MNLLDAIEKHKLIRRLVLVWAVALITWVVVRVFGMAPPVITGGTATALGTVIGILGTVIALYKWMRDREDRMQNGNKSEEP